MFRTPRHGREAAPACNPPAILENPYKAPPRSRPSSRAGLPRPRPNLFLASSPFARGARRPTPESGKPSKDARFAGAAEMGTASRRPPSPAGRRIRFVLLIHHAANSGSFRPRTGRANRWRSAPISSPVSCKYTTSGKYRELGASLFCSISSRTPGTTSSAISFSVERVAIAAKIDIPGTRIEAAQRSAISVVEFTPPGFTRSRSVRLRPSSIRAGRAG